MVAAETPITTTAHHSNKQHEANKNNINRGEFWRAVWLVVSGNHARGFRASGMVNESRTPCIATF